MVGVISLENNLVRYTVISDIHTDAIPIESLKKEKKILLDHLDNNVMDLVIIAGDFFHDKILPDSPYMRESMKLFAEIAARCKKHGAKLRIINGTESHDNKQLEILGAMDVALDIDLKIFYKVEEEEVFPGFKVLFVPEEYVTDSEEYYYKYFKEDDQYAMVIGHGLIDKAAFIAHIQESENTRATAPIFKVKQLHEICYGAIYFGHIHTHMQINRFRYLGSYSRYSHGEEGKKGFMSGVFDIERKEFMDVFIENTLARKFTTIKLEESSPLFKEEPQVIVGNILQTIHDVLEDFLRIEVNVPEKYESGSLLVAMLNESVRNKKVKLKIISSHKEKMLEKMKEDVKEEMMKYKIIFDKNVHPHVKIAEFVKIKNGVHIPVEEVEDLLTP